jgi:hypothetical protein
MAAPAANPSLTQAWDAEYREITGQINRMKTANPAWRQRLQAEALHSQALIWPTDANPADVVLRRTSALLASFKQRAWLSAVAAASFESELSALTREARAITSEEGRQAVFARACALRRRLVFANPLLDFDDLVCMLEQPGEECRIGNDRKDINAQKQGLASWPSIDVDPSNPTGVEDHLPLPSAP